MKFLYVLAVLLIWAVGNYGFVLTLRATFEEQLLLALLMQLTVVPIWNVVCALACLMGVRSVFDGGQRGRTRQDASD